MTDQTVPSFHEVDAHTGASQIYPHLGSAAGRRSHPQHVWEKSWEDWKSTQFFGSSSRRRAKENAEKGGPEVDPLSVDAITGASYLLSEEEHLLRWLQEKTRPYPVVLSAVRGLSACGEHALGWIALSAFGWLVSPSRRDQWLLTGISAVGAHALAVILKRCVRRPRPSNHLIDVNVSTPSQLSFPSSHATSTTAWAMGAASTTGCPASYALPPMMMLSRMIAGVHYPTDVAVGAALGAATSAVVHSAGARLLRRWKERVTHDN